MISTGCLITDPPQFKPPKHTRPFLDVTSADPDPNKVLVVEESLIASGAQSVIWFRANVLSQDDPVGSTETGDFERVRFALHIDLGLNTNPLQPSRYQFGPKDLPAGGTLDQTDRRVSVGWSPDNQPVEPGCHTATLIVSHVFDDLPCPACVDDYSSITWQILRCNMSNGDCGALPVTGPRSCESLVGSCAQTRSRYADAGMELLQCPEGDATDGGTQ